MKRMIKYLLLLALLPVLYIAGNLLFAWLTELNPPAEEKLTAEGAATATPDSVLTFICWNIGYGGLGAKADFFYDGGKMVVSPKEMVEKYNRGIEQFIRENDRTDFFLLNEVDRAGRRSHNIDQAKNIAALLPQHTSAFAVNYDVKFIPVPYTNPMGRVLGGLQSLARFTPTESKRIQLPNKEDFPDKLFYLKRCLLLQRFDVAGGKQLVVINTHFEAYDNGDVKKRQMDFTRSILQEEFAKGNYVVMGGDWNISPPGIDPHRFAHEPETDYLRINAPADYLPGWQFAFDSTRGTNRKNKFAYTEGKTFTTIIDYFLTSPNVKVIEVKTIDLGFRYSDHQPVYMKVKLR